MSKIAHWYITLVKLQINGVTHLVVQAEAFQCLCIWRYDQTSSKVELLLWILNAFFCLVFIMPLCASVYLCRVVTCWERADLLVCLWCITVSLSLSHWYPGLGAVLDCIDS